MLIFDWPLWILFCDTLGIALSIFQELCEILFHSLNVFGKKPSIISFDTSPSKALLRHICLHRNTNRVPRLLQMCHMQDQNQRLSRIGKQLHRQYSRRIKVGFVLVYLHFCCYKAEGKKMKNILLVMCLYMSLSDRYTLYTELI